jgi:hypothetical protein
MKNSITETNDKLFEKFYGNGNYDHILNFDGTVNSEAYNEEQNSVSENAIAFGIGLLIWIPLILAAIGV